MIHARMMASLSRIMFLVSISVLLSACQSSTVNQPAPTLPPHAEPTPLAAWTHAWMTSEPCQAPCWYGITPGQTPISDALAILRTLPFVEHSTLERYHTGIQPGWAWRWTSSRSGYGRLIMNGDTIQRIELNVAEYIRLATILERLGPPRVMTFEGQLEADDPVYYRITLSWPDYGINGISVGHSGIAPQLQANQSMLNDITIQQPSELQKMRSSSWHGYSSFDFYARQQKSSL